MNLHFEWNPEKARRNLQNHQVGFDEAKTIFDDPQFIAFLDEEHSVNEKKFYNEAR